MLQTPGRMSSRDSRLLSEAGVGTEKISSVVPVGFATGTWCGRMDVSSVQWL